MRSLRAYSVETIVALCCLLFIAIAFLWSCHYASHEAPAASLEATAAKLVHADSFGYLATEPKTFPFSIDVVVLPTGTQNVASDSKPVTNVDGDLPFIVAGWAVDGTTQTAASGAYLTIDSKRFVALYGIARPDVTVALNVPDATLSGFEAVVPAMSLSSGRHSLGLEIVNARRTKIYSARTAVTIIVTRHNVAAK